MKRIPTKGAKRGKKTSICPHCKQPLPKVGGTHFVEPSFDEDGYYICKPAKRKKLQGQKR